MYREQGKMKVIRVFTTNCWKNDNRIINHYSGGWEWI